MTTLATLIPPPKTFGVLEFDHWRDERVRLAYDNYRRRLKDRAFQKGELELVDFPVKALPADCLGKEWQIFIGHYIQIHSGDWTKEDESKRVSESTFKRAFIRKGVRPTILAELYRWVRDYQKYADRVGLNKDEVGQRITQLKKTAKSVYLRARREVLGGQLPELEPESEGKTEQAPSATVEGITIVLEECKGVVHRMTLKNKRTRAVELWKQLRKTIRKKATQKALYDHAGEDKSDFYKWKRGEKPDGCSTDRAIREALTADWK